MRGYRTLLAASVAVLWFAFATSLAVAAPSYTDWSAPVNLGSVVNSTANELGPALSPDGLSLYISSNRPGGFGGNDIWVSQRATVSDAWGTPVNLGPTINTVATEFVPAFSEDGHWMFFASDRAGGSGGQDIYESYRSDVHDDFGWQAPTNLGTGVNSSADDNAATYFDDGGHPQLIFGSGRLGGAARDLFLSNLQPDGTWGQATLIPELSSPSTENRPAIREDGLEIFFYSDRPGGVGSSDLWTATRTNVDAPWGTPVNLGATVNSSAVDQHPYLSADGRTLVFSSNRAGGIGTFDLWMTTRNANLTVTADNQSRLFGQPNPPLSATVTGFVGGDTSAVVSGSAGCSTTATPSSPAGDYPITCTVGTLSAAGYSFATFVAGTLTVGFTSPCSTGTHSGPLTVSAGQAVCIGAGGVQSGPVRVNPGGSLDVEGGLITGPLRADGAFGVRLCGASLTGPLTISDSTGLVLAGGDAATGPCAANTIVGPVSMSGNTGAVEFNDNRIVGPVRISDTTGSLPAPDVGSVHALDNTVTGPVRIDA